MPIKIIGNRIGKQQRGVTFIELMISISVMSVVFGAFLGIALESLHDYEFFTTMNLVAQKNQEIVNTIRKDTISTKFYFSEDQGANTRSSDYMNSLELPPAVPPLTTTRFPLVDENGVFDVDTAGNEKTGNSLFFVKTLTPFIARNIQINDTMDVDFRINAYSFNFYYLTLSANDAIGASPDSLDLIRWSSFTILDYNQVMDIVDVSVDPGSNNSYYPRAGVVSAFVSEYDNYTSHYLWDSNETVDNSFYLCDTFGTVNGAPDSNMLIMQDPVNGLVSVISGGIKKGRSYGTIRTGKRMSVCMNRDRPGFRSGVLVPQLGLLNSNGDGFPHGFEVQIVGPASAREILLRVAIGKEGSKGIISRKFEVILTTRDL